MDVDTPPRPSFPPSATATTNPFHFAAPPPASEETLPDGHLAFDSSNFDPKDAFGLSGADAEQEAGDESMLDGEKEEEATSSALSVIGAGESRRRKGGAGAGAASRRDRSPERRRRATGEDEDQDGEGIVLGGRRIQGSEFSFQVHHHHAGEGGAATPLPERWLNSNTPYTLLGRVLSSHRYSLCSSSTADHFPSADTSNSAPSPSSPSSSSSSPASSSTISMPTSRLVSPRSLSNSEPRSCSAPRPTSTIAASPRRGSRRWSAGAAAGKSAWGGKWWWLERRESLQRRLPRW